jgi:DNA polymerase-1
VPGINDKGPRKSFSERAAINAPLQGTAADIIKRAMINIHHELKDNHHQTAMLLQVHDELVFEVPEAESNITPVKIKELMESAARLSVPLTVETGLGANWGEIH